MLVKITRKLLVALSLLAGSTTFATLGLSSNGQSPTSSSTANLNLAGQAVQASTAAIVGIEVVAGTPAPGSDGSVEIDSRAHASGYISPVSFCSNMSFSQRSGPDAGESSFPTLPGRPEPLNVIFSGHSWFSTSAESPAAAKDSSGDAFLASGGFAQYLSALSLSDECLGLHFPPTAVARIDSQRPTVAVDSLFHYRENFGDGVYGACRQSLAGGLELRGWRQPESGAWFLGARLSTGLDSFHVPVADGYNLARDELVRRAKAGGRDSDGCTWPPATVKVVTDLARPDVGGVAGTYAHGIGIDGTVAVLTVGRPSGCVLHNNGTHTTNNNNNGTNGTHAHAWTSGVPFTAGPVRIGGADGLPTVSGDGDGASSGKKKIDKALASFGHLSSTLSVSALLGATLFAVLVL